MKKTIEQRLETEVLAYPAVSVGREKAPVIVAGWGVCEERSLEDLYRQQEVPLCEEPDSLPYETHLLSGKGGLVLHESDQRNLPEEVR